MSGVSNISKRDWIWQSLLWFILWILISGSASLYEGKIGRDFISFLLQLPLIIGSAYFVFYWVIPRVWKNNNRTLAVVLIFFTYALVGLGNRFLMAYVIYPWLYANDHTFTFFNWYRIVSQIMLIVWSHALFGTFKFFLDGERASQRAMELMDQKQQAELAFLKAQVHPHFLFNSLNALYNEMIQNRESAQTTLLKLTGIYRYVLEECQEEFISLKKEMELIENYIDLEKGRYGPRLKVQIKKSNLGKENQQIPPLVLFSFVENAFKHGVSEQKADCLVDISLEEINAALIFKIENPMVSKAANLNGYKSGIGLQNTQRQLNLIFGNDYSLSQTSEVNVFKTELVLPIRA